MGFLRLPLQAYSFVLKYFFHTHQTVFINKFQGLDTKLLYAVLYACKNFCISILRIVKEHPALAQAASHVIAAVTEDTNTRQMMPISNDESAEMADLEGMDPGVRFLQ